MKKICITNAYKAILCAMSLGTILQTRLQAEAHQIRRIASSDWMGIIQALAQSVPFALGSFIAMYAQVQMASGRNNGIEIGPIVVQYNLKDFIGTIPQELQELINYLNVDKRKSLQYHGVNMSKGCILYGKPGVGKTFLAQCIAGEAKVPCIVISAADIFNSKWMGVSSQRVRNLLSAARKAALRSFSKTCIIIIDEADSLLGSRSFQNNTNGGKDYTNAVNTLLSGVDGVKSDKDNNLLIYTIACTNAKPDNLDAALRRSGRFETQIEITPPNLPGTVQLLNHYLKQLKVFPADKAISLNPWQQGRIATTAEHLYTHYTRINGYISPVDIKRSAERAIDAVHDELELKHPVHSWWKRWFSKAQVQRENQASLKRIDDCRNTTEFLSRVLSKISKQYPLLPQNNDSGIEIDDSDASLLTILDD